MAMLALSHAILSVSAGTGELSESPLLSEKLHNIWETYSPAESARKTRIGMENWV
jgi:hypothetical protein